MPCSTTHRSTSAAAPESRGSTVANATRRSGAAATNAASESFAAGEGCSRPSYVNTTDIVDAELVHRRDVLLGAVPARPRLVDVEVDHAAARGTAPDASAIRSASSRLASASASPGTGGVPSSTCSTNAWSWSAKHTSVLSPGGSSRSWRPSAKRTSRPKVGGSRRRAPERAGDDELARGQDGVEPDHLDPRDRAVGVGEHAPVHVRRREPGVAAQAPPGDLDRRRAEHVEEPVAACTPSETTGAARSSERSRRAWATGSLSGVAGSSHTETCTSSGRAERPFPDERAQPLDRRVMAVGEPDLEPARGARYGGRPGPSRRSSGRAASPRARTCRPRAPRPRATP